MEGHIIEMKLKQLDQEAWVSTAAGESSNLTNIAGENMLFRSFVTSLRRSMTLSVEDWAALNTAYPSNTTLLKMAVLTGSAVVGVLEFLQQGHTKELEFLQRGLAKDITDKLDKLSDKLYVTEGNFIQLNNKLSIMEANQNNITSRLSIMEGHIIEIKQKQLDKGKHGSE
ncbi:hypothetical protein CEUSTIGMA_g13106.t1 [Chlamydomonas eustigma]|uniref:Uncharacterized protein n=1 Tax=Chlamydomonas eustigma TaxID=1157962 RepID=A0A250XRH8_9CHLO|nr:hypothetical protein CEUSTIGMA_g13106.t1 [Chlamydomonas eustigma]|eukprot:GAX85691.1 hypothetical protein CEUSTIGMA_g13106.t1 [Chlamydomonas eustigma]